MKMPPEQSVLKIIKMDGIESINLEPEEAFVLTRVNGSSTLKEISQVVGYDIARVWKLLTRSVEAGILVVEAPSAPATAKPKTENILNQLDEEDKDPILSKVARSKRNEILLHHQAMSKQNHYEVLGVSAHATDEKIREAYFQLAKSFHPDRFFGKELGHYRLKIEQLYGKITEAYEELNDFGKKKVYDQKLQRLKSATQVQPHRKPKGNTLIERIAQGKKYFEMGRNEEDAGNGVKAANFYKMALHFEPDQAMYQKAMERTAPFISRLRAEDLFKKAKEKLDLAEIDEAIELMEESLTLYPKKRECLRELPLLYLKKKSNLIRARELAEIAVLQAKNDAEVHTILALIYTELKMETEARKEFKAALDLDKNCDAARDGLAALKGK